MPVGFPIPQAIPNVSNFNLTSNLAKWRLALAKVRDGTSNARILCVGDSTTTGIGTTLQSTYPNTGSYPTRLAAMLNSYYAPAANGLIIPPSNFSGYSDNRWTMGSWAKENFGAANGACYASFNTSTGNLVCTPGVNADSYYVYYLGNSGLGTFNATATGGSAVGINCNESLGIYRTLVSASSASSSNTVTMVETNSDAIYVVGVEPYLSTQSQILVGNAGVAGATTANWAANPTTFGGIPFIETVAPDLTIISLGINDAGNSVSPATFASNMQSLITAAKVSGDCILLDYALSTSSAPAPAYEQQYLPYYASLAAANNCVYASINARFGGVNPGTSWMYDTVHFNDDGYLDEATFLRNLLMSV